VAYSGKAFDLRSIDRGFDYYQEKVAYGINLVAKRSSMDIDFIASTLHRGITAVFPLSLASSRPLTPMSAQVLGHRWRHRIYAWLHRPRPATEKE